MKTITVPRFTSRRMKVDLATVALADICYKKCGGEEKRSKCFKCRHWWQRVNLDYWDINESPVAIVQAEFILYHDAGIPIVKVTKVKRRRGSRGDPNVVSDYFKKALVSE